MDRGGERERERVVGQREGMDDRRHRETEKGGQRRWEIVRTWR